MEAAWIAVIGTAVAAAGAATAATIAAWSGRRQTSAQGRNQALHWRREKRRDAYAAFAESAGRARDELATILRMVDAPRRHRADLTSKLRTARELTDGVRTAGATISVEGPDSIMSMTMRVEEDLIACRRFLEAIVNAQRLARGEVVIGGPGRVIAYEEARAVVAQLQRDVQDHLDSFADAARIVLDGQGETIPDNRDRRQQGRSSGSGLEQDALDWLLSALRDSGFDMANVDLDRQIRDIPEMDSLQVMRLFNRAHNRYLMPDRWSSREFAAVSLREAAVYLSQQNPR